MIARDERTQNEIAYGNLKAAIDQTYPKGRFVAIHNGQVVADSATLEELLAALTGLGLDPKECLAIQAGTDYPEFAYILLFGGGS
jgi:hypothetical protein